MLGPMAQADLEAGFKKVLDSHGYGFQNAVIKECERLSKAVPAPSPWWFEASEFPVECGTALTRIDFILRINHAVLVAECKRANPALASWCFARAPFLSRRQSAGDVRLEQFWREPSTGRVHSQPTELRGVKDQYQVAFEMRTSAKGEANAMGRGAVEEAVTQVLRGANGLMNYVGQNSRLFDSNPMIVVPVVFTTADLLCSDADLSQADLVTGNVPTSSLTPRPWIWFQHNVSQALEHSLPKFYGSTPLTSLAQMLRYRHARSVAIVGPGGIANFLTTLPDDFEDFMPLRRRDLRIQRRHHRVVVQLDPRRERPAAECHQVLSRKLYARRRSVLVA